jgi:serine/threonine-protein kinase RsbW/sigma-B regulation protein RsbU (phosphoserine phosphatase)
VNPRTVRHAIFAARLAEADALRAFVDGACAGWAVERAAAYKLNLIAEELFTNTVKHGHRGDSDALIAITMQQREQGVQLTLEDDAPAFNPFRFVENVNATDGATEQRVGGLGVLLVCELSSHGDYAYLFGRNRVRLTVCLAQEHQTP